jgi:predicted transposase/invertase (TIGR01784 family)
MSKKLIRFDWAIKKLLRNKANFVVLEGFLSELLFEDIKIKEILESEGNQDKSPPAPEGGVYLLILIYNSKNEFNIIEILNLYQLIPPSGVRGLLNLGQAYSEIKKVISVNIVYFDLGQGKDYVYKGLTTFEGLHKKDVLQLSAKQKATFVKEQVSDIFPEYYIIKVNKFNDKAQDTLDEWIYFLKNNEVKDEFVAKGLHEARDILDLMRLNKDQQYSYNRYLDYLHYKASEALSLKEEAESKIREDERSKAEQNRNLEIAKKAILEGLDNELIAKITGLSIEQIQALRKELNL